MIGLSSSISPLAKGADRPDWTSLDISVHQRALSHCIDEVSYQLLFTPAPVYALKPAWPFLPLFHMLEIGSMSFLPLHLGFTFMTESSGYAYNIDWV